MLMTCGAARCRSSKQVVNKVIDLTGTISAAASQIAQADTWKTSDLSPQAVQDLQRAWSQPTGELGRSMCSPDSISVDSFKRLRPGRWLNDECINMFLSYLESTECPVHTLFMSTFFKDKLLTGEPPRVRAVLTKKLKRLGVPFSKIAQILIPCNPQGNHWTLVSIRTDLKTILYYDSFSSSSSFVKDCLNWVEIVHVDEGLPFDRTEWTIGPGDSPEQTNGYDCGVFVCTAALFLRADLPLDYSAEQMPRIRQHLARTILNTLA